MMKKPKPLKVIVKNRPSIEEAKRKIEEISKELSAIYSQELRRED
mgnify:CR=1 FL=1|jgi:hypothetical protein